MNTNTAPNNYGGLLLIIGLSAALVSLFMNLSFAGSISTNATVAAVMVAAWAVFDAAKLSISYGIGWAWQQGKFILSGILAVLVLSTTLAFSVFSGQSFLAGAFDSVNQSRLQSSDEYKDQRTTKQAAQERAANTAISPDAIATAKDTLAGLETEKMALLSGTARNMAGTKAGAVAQRVGDCTGGGFYVGKYCPQIRGIDSGIQQQQQIIAQGAAYSNALANVERVSSQPATVAVSGMYLPGIQSVARSFGVEPQAVQDFIVINMGWVLEAISILFVLMAGLIKTRRVYSVPEMQQAIEQYKSFAGQQLTAMPADILPHAIPDKAQAEPVQVQDKTQVKGSVYQCAECGNDYTAKHKNHARCTECSTQARQSFVKAKDK